MLELDMIQTVAFAGLVLFLGYGLRRLLPRLAHYNIPAPVVGGLVIALVILAARQFETTLFKFDTALQSPLMIAFFTSIGFGASYSLLKVGGPQALLFFGIVSVVGTLAVASAMAGIVSAGLVGGPITTFIIKRYNLRSSTPASSALPEQKTSSSDKTDEDKNSAFVLLKNIVIILAAMWLGGGISKWLTALNITLPAYIGAMVVAAVIRNVDDRTKVFGLKPTVIDDLGHVALSLFLVLALMTLKLWELAGLALPLLVILSVQIILVVLLCLWPVFQLMGRDYESAVMVSGFCGFMLGITANAMANMNTLVERYGPAPRAFLIVPMIAAFFIDFPNAALITACLNWWAP
ncbi:sodium/glutamate symporter [candidate division KSB1 bacterium]|nr:MAG: sodium/glutamate symporter [candidate division KSB1 bacterium]